MKLIFAFTLLLLTGCATEFMGAPHVNRAYCEKWCKDVGLECTGMMALGEYSSGCICTKPAAQKSAAIEAAQAAAGSAVAVISAKRRRDQLTVSAMAVH